MKKVWILFFNDQAAQNQKNPDYSNLLYKGLKEKAHGVQVCGWYKNTVSLA